MKYNEKQSAVDLTDLAIGVVVLGIVVGVSASILANIGISQITNVGTYSVLVESVTPTDAGAKLAKVWGKSVDFCQNGTTGPTITSGNYSSSVDSTTGVITLKNLTSTFTHAAWTCNYTVYNTSDPRYALPNNATIGLNEYGNWFKIIVITGIAAVILGLIFMAFGRGSSQVTQSY